MARATQGEDRALLRRRPACRDHVPDASSIYEVPLMLEEAGLGDYIVQLLGLNVTRRTHRVAGSGALGSRRRSRRCASRSSASTSRCRDAYLTSWRPCGTRRSTTAPDLQLELGQQRAPRRGHEPGSRASTASWCPAASAIAASRARSRAVAIRPRAPGAVPGPLPRHADAPSWTSPATFSAPDANSTEFDAFTLASRSST